MRVPLTKADIDKRICDVEGGNNTETYREFIENTEREFELVPQDLDKMTDKQFNHYVDFLSYIWDK
jgi:hypothetical protein